MGPRPRSQPPAGGAFSRRFTHFAGLFFDEFTGESAWLRERGTVRLPPLDGLSELVVRGEIRPHPQARGLETAAPGLAVALNGRPVPGLAPGRAAGPWELRGSAAIHTFSAMMCWAACDRLRRISRAMARADRAEFWGGEAERLKAEIVRRTWSERHGSFVSTFDGDELDASLLLMAQIGFVAPTDERYVATVERIGRVPAIMVGSVVLGAGTTISVVLGYSPVLIFVGLLLLGVGWSFGLIAGSTLLSEVVPVANRVEVQGAGDLLMSLCGGVAAFSSGFVKQSFGYHTLAYTATLLAGVLLVYTMASRRPVAQAPAT